MRLRKRCWKRSEAEKSEEHYRNRKRESVRIETVPCRRTNRENQLPVRTSLKACTGTDDADEETEEATLEVEDDDETEADEEVELPWDCEPTEDAELDEEIG